MGASREVLYSALAEPALLIGLAAIARETKTMSLSQLLPMAHFFSPEIVLVVAALMVVFLCENARIPFDDPNTHLELTMIHEVMVLDHSGPDFAFILYSSALKFWVLGLVIIGIIFPSPAGSFRLLSSVIAVFGLLLLAVVVGIIESTMGQIASGAYTATACCGRLIIGFRLYFSYEAINGLYHRDNHDPSCPFRHGAIGAQPLACVH